MVNFKRQNGYHIILTKEREAEIESCFQCEVEFHYLQDQVALSDLMEEFKNGSSKNSNKNNVNNIFGEKKQFVTDLLSWTMFQV